MNAESALSKFWSGLRHVVLHVAISFIAIAVAFSLPKLAGYVLFNWWPRIRDDTRKLIYVEIGLAAILVLIVNFVKLTWNYRKRARMSEIASLVYARNNDDWLSRRVKDTRVKKLPWKRDLTILAVTGRKTFAAPDSALRSIIADCHELRVMLIHPYGTAAKAYAAAHTDSRATLEEIRREIASSIAVLRSLRGPGKNIALKFYDELPLWKLVFIGEHVWVRCSHEGRAAGEVPEYVFALHRERPSRGFFSTFYAHFLNRWRDHHYPEYSFDENQLVFRDELGAELRREPGPANQAATVNESDNDMEKSLHPASAATSSDTGQKSPPIDFDRRAACHQED